MPLKSLGVVGRNTLFELSKAAFWAASSACAPATRKHTARRALHGQDTQVTALPQSLRMGRQVLSFAHGKPWAANCGLWQTACEY